MMTHVYERDDFASAAEKYAGVVEEARRTGRLCKELSHYTETETLSEIEAEIFEIDPALIGELFWAYERYENLIGTVDATFFRYREQERTLHAKYFKGEGVYAIGDAVDFMVEVCGLPAPQCFGWAMKVLASQLRGGLMDRTETA